MTRSDGLGAPGAGWPVVTCGVVVIVLGLAGIVVGGDFPGPLTAIVAGVMLVVHPWLRVRWYRTGYADGYVDGRGQPPHITCPRCGATSWNPHDITEGYCGNCHGWTSPRKVER